MASACHHDGPCPVPPHPDLLARQRVEQVKVQGTAQEPLFRKKKHLINQGQRTGGILGLNDGTIFPKSHFAASTPLSAIRTAAINRTPLQGAIK